jgi:hypothetical protein
MSQHGEWRKSKGIVTMYERRTDQGLEVCFGKPRDCGLVALTAVTGRPRHEVERAASRYTDFMSGGIQTWQMLALAKDFGCTFKVVRVRNATKPGKDIKATVGEYRPPAGRGFVFSKDHVMPYANGEITNLCGCSGDAVELVTQIDCSSRTRGR